MDLKHKNICLTLQVLLWLWFGTITSFVSVNVVNIARLETEIKQLNHNIDDLEDRILFLKQQLLSK
jgi:hypothetical protein